VLSCPPPIKGIVDELCCHERIPFRRIHRRIRIRLYCIAFNSIQRERLEELTFVGPDAAVVRFESMLTGDTRSPDKVMHSRKSLVVTRRDGVWAIGWGQNTRFANPPSSK
jgi:hypothetical protein